MMLMEMRVEMGAPMKPIRRASTGPATRSQLARRLKGAATTRAMTGAFMRPVEELD